MHFSEKLSQIMERQGLTQGMVAEGVRVSRPAVSRWLSGQARPHPGKARSLATFLNQPLDWLMDDTRNFPSTTSEVSAPNDLLEITNGILFHQKEAERLASQLKVQLMSHKPPTSET